MRNNLLKYILALSLLLNFSLLGAAGYSYYHQSRYRPLPFGYGPGGGPAGLSGQPYLFEALALKPEQRRLFEQQAPLFHEALDKEREKVDRLRKSLFGLMREENPDRSAIDATIAEINSAQRNMQKRVVAHMLAFKSMLDKDQQKKFFDLIEGAMAGMPEAGCPEAFQR